MFSATFATELKELERKAIKEVVDEQANIGVDILTDGEVPRENYIHHFW